MRVAFLGIKGLPAYGGAERVVEALVTRLPRLGVTPTVYCDQAYTPSDACIPGVKLIRLKAVSGKHSRQASLNVQAALHALLRGKYDLIHLHNAEAGFVLPLLGLRYKVVATSHGQAYKRAKWSPLARRLLQLMDIPFVSMSSRATCVAAPEAQRLSAQYGRQVAFIPNGVGGEVEPDQAGAAAIMAAHGLHTGGYLLFVAGRIEPTKGAHLAIEAVNKLGAPLPLLIVGDDSHVPAYSAQLRSSAGPHVRFQPLIANPATLFGLMKGARCLIFPSLMEAMAMVLLEAAALGVPIVCSDIAENCQVMQADGTYFASGNAADLAARLAWVLEHPEAARKLSGTARRRIRAEYAWDSIVERYARLYQEVCDGMLYPSAHLP